MLRAGLFCCVTVLLAALVAPRYGVDAADGLVLLKQLPAVAKGVDSLPRIADPDAAEALINADLEKRDRKLRRDMRECRAEAGQNFDWERSVEVAMRGPRYLSLSVSDSYDCGGPYPPSVQAALVYDLKTGFEVNWRKLIPGTKEGDPGVSSRALTKLYIKLMAKKPARDMTAPDDCRDVFDDGDDMSFLLWPDAKHGALILQPSNLPHVMQACGDPADANDDDMRALGVPDAMRSAIKAAHEAEGATK